jgi:ABC-type phosphate transport system substrate-binding protein
MNRKKVAAIAGAAAIAMALLAAVVILAAAPPRREGGAGGPGGGNSNNTGPAAGNNNSSGTGANGTQPAGSNSNKREVVRVLAPPSASPFVERWVAQYNSEQGRLGTAQVDYTGEVDDPAIPALYRNASAFLEQHSADVMMAGRIFADTEYGLSSQFVPVSPHAVAIVYNVPGFPDVPSGLRLNATVLAAVLSGNASRWDDPRIVQLNPGVSLPDKEITVVHEGQAGAATELVLRYAKNNNNGTAIINNNNSSGWKWPEKSLAAGSADSLSTIVRQTPYSAGYVDFAYAVQTRMTYAALQNADGQYVLPSAESIGEALRNATISAAGAASSGAGRLPPGIPPAGPLGNGSYPIVDFYYAAAAGALPGDSSRNAAMDLLEWMTGEHAQQILHDLQYPSIYQDPQVQPYVSRVFNQTLAAGAEPPAAR